ncbi:glycosyltransferase family 2 protein [Lutibacter sp. A80]|uniref:glycosyltransferase family 2 protein n=1 Tax=Lutibacter sp. A80 TaxID=2918453 RepID=UPI001F06C5E8|nr:glycosyltransferase family 2 protein [Lutibacter sp. A80]UMB61552.1 glycosyltransferase family 2 protein [Lutibacter sp. A80]
MKIAIVILNWNGQQLLEKFLPTLLNFSNQKHVEIYVADNASTDTSISYVKKTFPTVKIVENKKNGGYAKGYNDALKYIEADIYGLINSDIEVTEGWLNPIISTFNTAPETSILQPKILDYKNKALFEYAGAAGGFIDKFGYPFCRGRIFSELEKDNSQFNDTCEIFWASGACFFIKSNVFKELNGFDEDYFAHQEEIDLCWRAKNLNYNIKYVGASTVYHVGGATLKEESPRKSFLNFRNSLFTLVKNVPKKQLFGILFMRLILDGIAGVKFLIELRPMHTIAIIKAHFSFYIQFSKMFRKRGTLEKRTDYFRTKSIVWQHFILGKKKYSTID